MILTNWCKPFESDSVVQGDGERRYYIPVLFEFLYYVYNLISSGNTVITIMKLFTGIL